MKEQMNMARIRLKMHQDLRWELLAAVREKIKDRLAIEYRINANDMIEGSPSLDEVIAFVKRIEPHIDLLHVSRGMHSSSKNLLLI